VSVNTSRGPVADYPVTFSVRPSSFPLPDDGLARTGADGIASILLESSTYDGQVTISASAGGLPAEGSGAIVSFGQVLCPASPPVTVTPRGPLPADGETAYAIVARAARGDGHEIPVVGVQIEFAPEPRSGLRIVEEGPFLTGSDGTVEVHAVADRGGTHSLNVTTGDVVLQTVQLTFDEVRVDLPRGQLSVARNRANSYTASVLVQSLDGPVADYPVTFSVRPDAFELPGGGITRTGRDGIASILLESSTYNGELAIAATLEGGVLAAGSGVVVQFEQPACRPAPLSVSMSPRGPVPADGQTAYTIRVYAATEACDPTPIAGLPVEFTPAPRSGLRIVEEGPYQTGRDGIVEVHAVSDRAGIFALDVSTRSGLWTTLRLAFESIREDASPQADSTPAANPATTPTARTSPAARPAPPAASTAPAVQPGGGQALAATKAKPQVKLTAKLAKKSVKAGSAAKLRIAVKVPAGVRPASKVTVRVRDAKSGAAVLKAKTVRLKAGKATVKLRSLPVGKYAVKVAYKGSTATGNATLTRSLRVR
jgi:hypothetical protein